MKDTRKKIWLLFFMLLALGLAGQDMDSLYSRPDSLRVDSLLVRTGDLFKLNRLSEAMQSASTAFEEADEIGYRQAKGLASKWMGDIEDARQNYTVALRHYFGAIREFEWSRDSLGLLSAYRDIGDIYLNNGLRDKALEYYRKSLALMEGSGISEERTDLMEGMAEAYTRSSRYDSALVILQKLLDDYRVRGNKPMALSAIAQMAVSYYFLGEYDLAQEMNFEALALSRDLNDTVTVIGLLNNIGYIYKYLGNYSEALDYFQQAYTLQLEKPGFEEETTVTLANIGIVYQNLGRNDDALDALFKGLKIAENRNDRAEIARLDHLIASIYFLKKDYYNAQVYNNQSMDMAASEDLPGQRLSAYLTSSQIHAALFDFEQAMSDYQKYLSLRDSLEFESRVKKQELAQQQYTVEKTEKEIEQVLYDREIQSMEMKQLRLAAEKKEQELELLKKTSELQESIIENQKLEKARTMQDLLLAEEKLAAEKKDREIQDLKYQQQLQESELRRRQLEQEQAQRDIELLTKDNELKDANLARIRSRNKFLAGIFLLSLIIIFIVVRAWIYARKTNRKLAEQRNKIQQQKEAIEDQFMIIQKEREKSDNLLLNILPEETAAELKEKGAATPVSYELVSVLFTDFVGFTMVAEKLSPEELVQELNICFGEFDRIIGRHKLEKIKTIGDAYMCAGGIPVPNKTNPSDAVSAALEMMEFMNRMKKERSKTGKGYWDIRIGIHTGTVIAGVVGKKKFAYDIWGDAVNTASRMESSGEPNRINISGATYRLVKDQFECTYRGKIKAKNKGEIDMYFVDKAR